MEPSFDRFPGGRFEPPTEFTPATLAPLIDEIAEFPARLRSVVEILAEQTLDQKTLPGVWTIRQVVHHVADSHMNSFARFKLALTEEHPTIRPYDEGAWAGTPDGANAPVEHSLVLLEGLHARWVMLLRSLDGADLQRRFHHPADKQDVALGMAIASYAWHGRHHLAHIQATLDAGD